MKLSIGFSYSKIEMPILSRLIMWYMNTPYSHVYLKFTTSRGKTLIYEAVGTGVRFVGYNIWKAHASTVYEKEIEVSKELYTKVMDFCMDNAGKEYSVSQNLGIFLADILKLKSNPFPDNGTNCSEIIAEILKEVGIEVKKDKNLITPLDIYKSLT